MTWQQFVYPLLIIAAVGAFALFVLRPMINHWDKKNNKLAAATPSGQALDTSADSASQDSLSYERRLASDVRAAAQRQPYQAPPRAETPPAASSGLQRAAEAPSATVAPLSPLSQPSKALAPQVLAYSAWMTKLMAATHIFISGGKGAGKTTLSWLLIRLYAAQGYKFIFIDPHHLKGEMGEVRPHAAGRRFHEAARVFRYLIAELDRRYKLRSDEGVEQFDKLMLVCDEFDALTDKKRVGVEIAELAATFYSMLGDESRKVFLGAMFLAHGMEVKNLGIEGKGSKRDNYAAVFLTQGPDEKPEPTGQLVIGSGEWEIDTRSVKSRIEGWKPSPPMVFELPALSDDEAGEEPVYTAEQVRMMLAATWHMADHRHTQRRKAWSYRSVGAALFDGQNEGENFYTTKRIVNGVSALLETAGIVAATPVSGRNTQKQGKNNTDDNTPDETLAALLAEDDVKDIAKAA